MTIYDEYDALLQSHRAKYGCDTVVLMQVGDFFEMYDITPGVGSLHAICDACHLHVTRKNKNVPDVSRQNPWMAGFPQSALSKYTDMLLLKGHTVVVVRQVTPPPNPKRSVTEVLSPSCQWTPRAPDGQFLMVQAWDKRGGVETMGLAVLEGTTGHVAWLEIGSGAFLARDESVRWLEALPPQEVVLVGTPTLSPKDRADVEAFVRPRVSVVHAAWDADSSSRREAYQEDVLRRAYPQHGLVSPLDAFGDLRDAPLARWALVTLLQFAYEHNERLTERLGEPERLGKSDHCHLHGNSLQQLNAVDASGQDLLSLLNRCATAFGKRWFRQTLVNPWCEEGALTARYDAVDALLVDQRYAEVLAALQPVLDLERMGRRLALATLAPNEWSPFMASLEAVAHALAVMPAGKIGREAHEAHKAYCGDIRSFVADHIVVEEAARFGSNDMTGHVFVMGVCPEADGWLERLDVDRTLFRRVALHIRDAGAVECRVDVQDRDGVSLVTTKKRWATVMASGKTPFVWEGASLAWEAFVARPLSASSGQVRLSHPVLEAASHRLQSCEQRLAQANAAYYTTFLNEWNARFGASWQSLVRRVAEMDVAATHARNAAEYGYVRPQFDRSGTSGARLNAVGLRHPILERLPSLATAYMPNDVNLDQDGMLLYGINASGKSSLMKAVGLAVVMAQAGMFVPCDRFEWVPFRQIFTRILNVDNLFRGMSTFTVEMTELRNILMRSDAWSLVLGDELCAGTEATSALSIVAAGIHVLTERRASFIFATHLHALTETLGIGTEETPSVRACHMHVDMDEDGVLTYDRRLRPGSGNALYGLEVCRALSMPPSFLKYAQAVRHRVLGTPNALVSPQASRYNANVFMHRCAVCGKAATETHHILPQKDADIHGRIGAIPVHAKYNLVPLCDTCHKKEHHGHLSIMGFEMTSRGARLKQIRKKQDEDTGMGVIEVDAVVGVDAVATGVVDVGRDDGKMARLRLYWRALSSGGWQGRADVTQKWRTLPATGAATSKVWATFVQRHPEFASWSLENLREMAGDHLW